MSMEIPLRPSEHQARQFMAEEIARVGGCYRDTLTRTDQPRVEAKALAWWYAGNVEDEGTITARTKAYLRAYVRIAGNGQLHTQGLLLKQGRVHMDKYVIRRLHQDGYLTFNDSRISPYFSLTDLGSALIDGTSV